MRVRQLIELLTRLDPDYEVVIGGQEYIAVMERYGMPVQKRWYEINPPMTVAIGTVVATSRDKDA